MDAFGARYFRKYPSGDIPLDFRKSKLRLFSPGTLKKLRLYRHEILVKKNSVQ
jgi:hypothetical protein